MKSPHLRHLSLLLLILLLILVSNPVQATSYDGNYAWILVDILDNEGKEDYSNILYDCTSSYERDNYTSSATFTNSEGKSGILRTQAVYSGVPDIIYPDEPVEISLKMTTLENTITALRLHDPNANVPDTLCTVRFEDWETLGEVAPDNLPGIYTTYLFNEMAQQYFEINCRDSPTSYDEILSHTLGEGQKGHKVALILKYEGAYNIMSTHYIYEWKKISPKTDTQIESKEVQESNKDDKEVPKLNNELDF